MYSYCPLRLYSTTFDIFFEPIQVADVDSQYIPREAPGEDVDEDFEDVPAEVAELDNIRPEGPFLNVAPQSNLVMLTRSISHQIEEIRHEVSLIIGIINLLMDVVLLSMYVSITMI